MHRNKENFLPREITLHLTENCNLRCKMCYFFGETGLYSNSYLVKEPKIMDFELLKKIISELRAYHPFYSLFGGEPLTYPSLEELLLEIKKAGSIVDIPTNGTLLKQQAEMLVRTKVDSIRISLDGPQFINDIQRGKGSYKKAVAGIRELYNEKRKINAKKPMISIIYTVTKDNYKSVEKLFLEEFNLEIIDWVTIQMQNFITEEMGKNYAEFLKTEFEIVSDDYWRTLVRSPRNFDEIDVIELSHQVARVCQKFKNLGKNYLLLPPTFSPENLKAYLEAKWDNMVDLYQKCLSPWVATDITASGDVAPCHIFYDLVMGNLYNNNLKEIWNGENFQRFRDYIEQNKFMSICPGCCIFYLSGKRLKHQRN